MRYGCWRCLSAPAPIAGPSFGVRRRHSRALCIGIWKPRGDEVLDTAVRCILCYSQGVAQTMRMAQ